MNKKQRIMLTRIIVTALMTIMGGKTKRAMLSDGNWLGSLAMSAS